MNTSTTSSAVPPGHETWQVLRDMNNAEIERLIPTVVLLAVIAVFGIIGNSIVIHVYRTRYKQSNSKQFIMCVGAIDLLSCCVAIPFEIVLLLEQYTFEHAWLCKVSRFFNTLGTCSSSFILLFIAIDRYRKVCKPLAPQITTKHAKILCILSIALGLLIAWPAVFVYGRKTVEILIDGLDLQGTECSTTDEMSESKIPFFYAALFGVLFIAGICSMSILYCMIGYRIRSQARKMSQMFSFRSISIPNTSSIIDDRDARRSGELTTSTHEKYERSRKKKNEAAEKKRKHDSKKKRVVSVNNESWADQKEFELSYEYTGSDGNSKYSEMQNGKAQKNKTPNGGSDLGNVNLALDSSDVGDMKPVLENNDVGKINTALDNSDELPIAGKSVSISVGNISSVLEDNDAGNINHALDSSDVVPSIAGGKSVSIIDESVHNSVRLASVDEDRVPVIDQAEACPVSTLQNGDRHMSSCSIISSTEMIPSTERTFRQRVSSIGSRISHAFTRMTSIVSATTESSAGTLRQNQFLKQARARKTAFIMFVISLVYVISYMPHVILMVTRQVNSNFVDSLSDSGRAVYKFFLRSYFLNCAINPLIYGVCDSRFRTACADLFGCLKGNKPLES